MQPNHVRVQIVNPSASGRREGWWKRVTAVDPAGKNGYAVEGEFLKAGWHDLPLGAVLLEQSPGGSVRQDLKYGQVHVVHADGVKPYSDTLWHWRKEFVLLRDELLHALTWAKTHVQPVPANDLLADSGSLANRERPQPIDVPARIDHWTQKFADDPSLADDVAEVLLSVHPDSTTTPAFHILAAALNRFRGNT